MGFAENRSLVRGSSKSAGPSENARLATLACAVLLLNIVVGVTVHRALPHGSAAQTEEIMVSHGD